ncbi:unnamed protein product [Oikopleura dioica]|uniref:Enoyl reductase (ER) domain-containing protein n=1 Tax=Oikopleura dioica TaxID=34765 RepID=E4X3N7_OIKDI|nr:unnamed protein product [Oikopleura dioica]
MRTVKAINYDSFGGADVLRVGERDLGELRPKDVRIKVAYSALNRADLLQVAGKYPNQKAPLPLGLEAAGEIESVGENVQGLKVGDRVMALLNGGGYAEMQRKELRSQRLSCLAYQLLHWVGTTQEGAKVLIHGAGSGVGTSAIQLAKLNKNSIYATAGAESKLEKATELGAIKTLNYKENDFGEEWKAEKIDVILDCVGGDYWRKNMKVLGMDGIIVLYGLMGGVNVDGPLLAMILGKRAQIRGTTLMSRSEEYKTKLVSEFWNKNKSHFVDGSMSPVIDSIYDMTDVAEAHKYMATNKSNGKILLKMNL